VIFDFKSTPTTSHAIVSASITELTTENACSEMLRVFVEHRLSTTWEKNPQFWEEDS